MSHSQLDPTRIENRSNELLVRGQLALTALEYQEQAARFRAAASSLKAAMVLAENGDPTALERWLLENPESTVHWPRSSKQTRLDSAHDSSAHYAGDPTADGSSGATFCSEPEVPKQNTQTSTSLVSNNDSSIETPVAIETSPWQRIQKAAESRLEQDSDWHDDSDGHEETEQADDDNDAYLEASALFGNDSIDENESNETNSPTLNPELIEGLLTDVEPENASNKGPWWKSPHVYVSVGVHGLMILVMSFMVIASANQHEKVAIVAGIVEAENILIETPMEFPSDEMEQPQQGDSPSMDSVDLSSIASDVSLPSVNVEVSAPGPVAGEAIGPSMASSAMSALGGGTSGGSGNSMGNGGNKLVQGANFYGVTATGNTFIYVVDSSPSMRRDGAFEAAKKEMIRSLTSMKPKQRYFVNFFGKEVDPLTFESGVVEKYPIYATPENLQRTLQWMERVQIQSDGSPPLDALEEAIAMQPDAIFLLFDGDTKVDVAARLKRINRSSDILSDGGPKVPIHVVHFFNQEFQQSMKKVADENGGKYRFVPRPPRVKK